jgi:hypothetical protein
LSGSWAVLCRSSNDDLDAYLAAHSNINEYIA